MADDATNGFTEAKAKSNEDPQYTDDAQGDKALQHGGDHILLVDHAAIKKSEPWGHQEDKCTGYDHPGGVAGIDVVERLGVGAGGIGGTKKERREHQKGQRQRIHFSTHEKTTKK